MTLSRKNLTLSQTLGRAVAAYEQCITLCCMRDRMGGTLCGVSDTVSNVYLSPLTMSLTLSLCIFNAVHKRLKCLCEQTLN